MTPELLKTFKERWLEIGSFIVAVAGLLLNNWSVARAVGSDIWKNLFVNIWYMWLAGGLYIGYRLFIFGRNFYLESKEAHAASAALQAEVRAWFEEERNSRRMGEESITRDIDAKLKSIYDSLAKLINRREALELKSTMDAQKISQLKQEISELKQCAVDLLLGSSEPPKQEPTPAELLLSSANTSKKDSGLLQKAAPVPSLLDIFPRGGMLSKAAKPLKGTTNGG